MSSGAPPAAIAIIRISGPDAFTGAEIIAGRLPPSRTAALRSLRNEAGDLLDRALVLAFPAAGSATGEDLVEFHCHGGTAVVAAIDRALVALPGMRRAEGGEFTRRAVLNGRIHLTEAEALGDLLRAETESERIAAIAGIEGAVSRLIAGWQDRLLTISAQIEALIDYDDEDDISNRAMPIEQIVRAIAALRDEMLAVIAAPTVERLHDGIRIVLTGPRNAGKSTLFNRLIGRDAAIVSDIAGTTRDRIEAPVQRQGIAYLLIDTAGLVDDTEDPIEAIGVASARAAAASADLILWLGDTQPDMTDAIWIWSRADIPHRDVAPAGAVAIGLDDEYAICEIWNRIADQTNSKFLRRDVTLNRRHVEHVCVAVGILEISRDPVLIAESLRLARRELGKVTQFTTIDDMLDRLFSDFCVGK